MLILFVLHFLRCVSRAPINGDYLTVTSITGDRVYLPITSMESTENTVKVTHTRDTRRMCQELLTRSVGEMMEEIERQVSEGSACMKQRITSHSKARCGVIHTCCYVA